MRLRSAQILFFLYIFSSSFNQWIEWGHSLLHQIENPFHYHKYSKAKDFTDHSLVDHHFPKMKFAHEMDEPEPPSNFIAIAFGFFQPVFEYRITVNAETQTHQTEVKERSYSFHAVPPTPPPLLGAVI